MSRRKPRAGMVQRALLVAATFVIAVTAASCSTSMEDEPASPPAPRRPTPIEMAPQMPKPRGGVSAADKQFVTSTVLNGMMEVKLGELAQLNATSEDVKSFGEKMAAEHSSVVRELGQFVTRKGFAVPENLDAKRQAQVDRMAKLPAPRFDQTYMSMMVKEHAATVSAFKKASTEANDAGVKAWSARQLGKVEERLKLARETARKASSAPAGK